METSFGKQISIINELTDSPHLFDFFQAIRLLKKHLYQNKTTVYDEIEYENCLKFHQTIKNSFAVSYINSIETCSPSVDKKNNYHIYTTFMGLAGTGGVLPERFSEYLSQRIHQNDAALSDFLDIFNHVILNLLYITWSKNQLSVVYEEQRKNNFYYKALSSICGIGLTSLQDKLLNPDDVIFYYSGLLGRQQRSAKMLEAILTNYFQMPIRVIQFQSERLRLSNEDRTILCSSKTSQNIFNQLGRNTILGSTWQSIQNKFRVYIGPVNYIQFNTLKPGSELLKRLKEIVQFFVKYELCFDVQIELIANEIPYCQLLGNNPLMLGWNTWVHSKPFIENSSAVVIN